jgi:DNA-binding CsgD family transcriptional regulator
MAATNSAATLALERAVHRGHTTSGLPVVFAGRVRSGALRISRLAGNRSESLRGLTLPPDVGLGGKALAIGRPVSVRDYARARAISHEYDTAVAREGLRAMVAVPVRVHGAVTAVLYGGARTTCTLGDDVITRLVATGERLSHELEAAPATPPRAVEPSSDRPGPGRDQWRASVEALLATLSTEADDPLRREAMRICSSLLGVLSGAEPAERTPLLSERERAVLELVALGYSDLDIAESLDLDVVAVRTAMRGLRRVFGVRSRHAAVSAARRAGMLP